MPEVGIAVTMESSTDFAEFGVAFRLVGSVESGSGALAGHFLLQRFLELVARVQAGQGEVELVQDAHGEGARADGGA